MQNEDFAVHARRRRSIDVSRVLCEGVVGGGCNGNQYIFIYLLATWSLLTTERNLKLFCLKCMPCLTHTLLLGIERCGCRYQTGLKIKRTWMSQAQPKP